MRALLEGSMKACAAAVFVTTVALFAGCGGGGGGGGGAAPTTITGTLSSTNSTIAGGVITTNNQVTLANAGGTSLLQIPTGTAITGATPFTTLPVNITVTTPSSGVSGMPNPATAGFVIGSTAGAEDVVVGGKSTVTFSQPVTISIVVDPAKITTATVNMNKNDGNGWVNIGTASIVGNVATFTTTNLCWFGIDNVYTPATGGTGSTGGGGLGIGF